MIGRKRAESADAGRTILDFFPELRLILVFLCGGSACEYKGLEWL
jgi:hypothetical protein